MEGGQVRVVSGRSEKGWSGWKEARCVDRVEGAGGEYGLAREDAVRQDGVDLVQVNGCAGSDGGGRRRLASGHRFEVGSRGSGGDD